MKAFLAIVFFWSAGAGAAELFRGRLFNPNELRGHDSGEFAPRLFDARTHGLTASGGVFIPDRVYSVYHQGEKKWVYAQTDHWGKFAEPFELFFPGSMVVGNALGGDPRDTYKLSAKYDWELTPSPFRKQLVLVLADPPYFKRTQWYRADPFVKKRK